MGVNEGLRDDKRGSFTSQNDVVLGLAYEEGMKCHSLKLHNHEL